MMKIEENLAKTDLKNLKRDVLEQFILQAYKYQQFKTSVAIQKINRGHYTERTARLYLDATKQYLTHGAKSKTVGSRVYKLLDQFKASHVGILTPKENEKYIPRKLKPSSPTLKVHPHAKKMIKEIQQINHPKYGVKYENTIKIFDSKEFCLGYKECFEVFNKDKKAELVTVNYELVEDNKNGVENGTN